MRASAVASNHGLAVSATGMISLTVVMALLALVPSTSVALVVARSSTAGFLNGAAVAAGIVLGDITFVLLAVLGLATLAEVMGSFFLIVRFMAGVWLIWLGVSLLRSKAALRTPNEGSVSSLVGSVFSGLVVTIGDVKAIFFYASLFPVFVNPATIQASDIATIVMLTILAVGGVKLGYAYWANRIASSAAFKAPRAVEVATGGLLVGAGVLCIIKL